ncbi:MAG TPA: hypothetical protein VGR89_03175 [Puia sp.]|nr:hypothetical protein [Puia sp.]
MHLDAGDIKNDLGFPPKMVYYPADDDVIDFVQNAWAQPGVRDVEVIYEQV